MWEENLEYYCCASNPECEFDPYSYDTDEYDYAEAYENFISDDFCADDLVSVFCVEDMPDKTSICAEKDVDAMAENWSTYIYDIDTLCGDDDGSD